MRSKNASDFHETEDNIFKSSCKPDFFNIPTFHTIAKTLLRESKAVCVVHAKHFRCDFAELSNMLKSSSPTMSSFLLRRFRHLRCTAIVRKTKHFGKIGERYTAFN